jgi:hypothetical protein
VDLAANLTSGDHDGSMPWLALGLIVVAFGGMFCVFGWLGRRERRRQLAEAELAIEEFGRYDSDGMAASAAGL